jgi:Cu+-exporting ATPase
MSVEPGRAAGSFGYQGQTYHFCSQHCLVKFKAEPTSYAVAQQDAQASRGHHG